RVPLIVSGPPSLRAGHRVATPVSAVDIYPTVAECLGFVAPQSVSGTSLAPALQGGEITPRARYAETNAVHDAFGWATLAGVIDGRWKYVQTTHDELYNLADDPHELTNLIDTEPAKRAEMEELLTGLQQQMQRHAADDAALTAADRRKLESLGYVAGGSSPPTTENDAPLPDVKEMMVHYNAEFAARRLISGGRAAEAVQQMRAVIAAAPMFMPARMTLGAALLAHGDANAAIAEWEAAIQADPQAPSPHFELGKHYAAAGQTEKAIAHYEEAIRLAPHDAMSHFNLGSLLFAAGDFDKAREHYQQGLEVFPDSTLGQFNFSMILASRGELEEAVHHARRAADLSPRNPQFQFHLGNLLASQGNFADAVIQFEHTLQIAPDYPEGREHLNQALQLLGAGR
ncbi:MAG: tetratricopeptide repeat protein, partial [Planctomycetaceae bacterium]|nr:tetratricopeptide repeat protein [Planctomycetaceae bacterium]